MIKINCEEFHTCDKCNSYRYEAFLHHDYDSAGFNSKYGQIALIDEDNNEWRHYIYNDLDYGEEAYQPLENIILEQLEKNRYDELSLVFSGVCPKCHKKFYWTKYYNGDYTTDDAPRNFIKNNI